MAVILGYGFMNADDLETRRNCYKREYCRACHEGLMGIATMAITALVLHEADLYQRGLLTADELTV